MQVASYNTKKALACARCGGDVVVCVPEDIAYSGFPYIEGTIVSVRDTVNHCGDPVYNYGIRYDENELADLNSPLTQCQVNGLICRGCLTQYIDAYALFNAFCLVCTEAEFIAALANVYCKHIIVICSFSLTDDRELPAGKIMSNLDGAVISTAGNTLTLSGDLTSGVYQIFNSNAGEVVFNSGAEIPPEWFGAAGDGATDDKAAIQLAVDTVIASGKGAVKLSAGKIYYTKSTVTIGYAAEDFLLTGYGAQIYGDFDDIILEISDATGASGYPKNIVIEGVRIKGSLTAHTSYINQVGIDINSVDGLVLRDMVVYDITGIGIRGYPSSTAGNRVWRHVKWDHVAVDTCGLESTFISDASYEYDPEPAYNPDSLYISNCRFNRGGQIEPCDLPNINTLSAHSMFMEGTEFVDNRPEEEVGRDLITLGIYTYTTSAMLGCYYKGNGLQADGSNVNYHLRAFNHAGITVLGNYIHTVITANPATRADEPWGLDLTDAGVDVEGIRYHWEDYPFHSLVYVNMWNLMAYGNIIGPILNHDCDDITDFVNDRYEFQFGGLEGEGVLDTHHEPFQQCGRRVEDLQTAYDSADPSQVVLTGWGAGANIPSSRAKDSNGQIRVETDTGVGAANPVQVTINFADGDWEVAPTPIVQIIDTDDPALVDVDIPVRVSSDVDKLDIFAYMNIASNRYYDFSYQLIG
jgi:hypothetical protein